MLKRWLYRKLFGDPAPFCRCGAFLGCFRCNGAVCQRCRWEHDPEAYRVLAEKPGR